MRIPRAHAWPTFFTHQSSLFFSLQVVSKRFSSKNKFTGLICKTATPFVQVWHSKELQKCLLYSLWNAFRKKIFNFYSLIKQFCCYHYAGWVRTRWRSNCIVKYRIRFCLMCIRVTCVDYSLGASRIGITWLRQCVIPFLTSSTRMHPTIPIHTIQCFVLKLAQQAVMQTFLGKGLFLSVAPTVLPTVSWTLDKSHFGIVLIR